ncbi:MAG: radical SAM protein [Candidatus Omnitrophica bacterium]|nr:radical SAM protein [Candidatus Omnitrophota bacterium]MDD5430126.1 radical SAM protein [Candidatus Omnitrophota bacterium]
MEILAINPWITDFAAYDFWLKPYGFLTILTYLSRKNIKINYIDCLDKKLLYGTFGRGKFFSEIIEKPPIFKNIPRYFRRYGISLETFEKNISKVNPDFILITSSMTYWYPGIIETVRILKAKFPKVPVILGGTYATLCFKHAKKTTGCDHVFKNNSLEDFFSFIGVNLNLKEFYSTLPEYSLFYKKLDYAVFRTSWGCPFDCSFCAIKKLSGPFFRINPEIIIDFIDAHSKQGIKNFILYDDAFLYEPSYAKKILAGILKLEKNLAFHTPNALHLRFLDLEIAKLMKKCGFINPHFGLETLDSRLQLDWGNKVNKQDLIKAIRHLKQAGFKNGEFSVYLLLGYPKQDLNKLKDDVIFLNAQGTRVSLAEFSPTPGTRIFKDYARKLSDPLLHNNSIFGLFQEKKLEEFWNIKNYVRRLNKNLDSF